MSSRRRRPQSVDRWIFLGGLLLAALVVIANLAACSSPPRQPSPTVSTSPVLTPAASPQPTGGLVMRAGTYCKSADLKASSAKGVALICSRSTSDNRLRWRREDPA